MSTELENNNTDSDFTLKQKISIIMEIDKTLRNINSPSITYFFPGYRGSCMFRNIISALSIDDIRRLFSKIYSLGVGRNDNFTKDELDANISSICDRYRYKIPNMEEVSVIYDIFTRYGLILDIGIFEIIEYLENMTYMEHDPLINVYYSLVINHDADVSYGREFADIILVILIFTAHDNHNDDRIKSLFKRFNLSYMISHIHPDIKQFIEDEISKDILNDMQHAFHRYVLE